MLKSIFEILLNVIFPQKHIEKEIYSLLPEHLGEKLYIKEHKKEYMNAVSLFKYKDPVIRQMIWLLKYKKNTHVAKLFASVLYDYLIEELSDEIIFSSGEKCIIVPLPLSKKRERERGFNQMKLVSDELQRLGEFAVDSHILIKKKHTAPQTSLSNKEDRAKNIKGAFKVNATDDLERLHVILVDDVLTTGSTLHEARKTLKEAGVHKISCLTLAH